MGHSRGDDLPTLRLGAQRPVSTDARTAVTRDTLRQIDPAASPLDTQATQVVPPASSTVDGMATAGGFDGPL